MTSAARIMLYFNFDGLVEHFIQFNAIVNYVHIHFLSTPARKLKNHYTESNLSSETAHSLDLRY